jgi:hypothetical protein
VDDPAPPREQLTVYCQWDELTKSGQYVIGVGARGRIAVAGSQIKLLEMLPLDGDSRADLDRKHENYVRVHGELVKAIDDYAARSGAKIEKLEISFAKDATTGAKSGTAPWAFVSLAIDASNAVNNEREKAQKPRYELTFKFTDALQQIGR